jgi:hypothetical protein
MKTILAVFILLQTTLAYSDHQVLTERLECGQSRAFKINATVDNPIQASGNSRHSQIDAYGDCYRGLTIKAEFLRSIDCFEECEIDGACQPHYIWDLATNQKQDGCTSSEIENPEVPGETVKVWTCRCHWEAPVRFEGYCTECSEGSLLCNKQKSKN